MEDFMAKRDDNKVVVFPNPDLLFQNEYKTLPKEDLSSHCTNDTLMDCIKMTIPVVYEFKASPVRELEVRFGHISSTGPLNKPHFVNGMDRNTFFRIYQFFRWNETQNNSTWTSRSKDWNISIDVFWDKDIRGTVDKETHFMFIRKKRLHHMDFDCTTRGSAVGFRLSLHDEIPVNDHKSSHPYSM